MVNPDITLRREEEYWVALDTETGVGAQGATREEALAELDDAVALHTGETDEMVENEVILWDLDRDSKEVEPMDTVSEFLR